MEPHSNLKLLFISVYLVISFNVSTSQLSPEASPGPELAFSQESASPGPSPSPAANPSLSYISLPPSSAEAPSESISPNAELGSETISVNAGFETENRNPFDFDFSSMLHSVDVNPDMKKICYSTDHPALCLGTALPLLKGNKFDAKSILQVTINATNKVAKYAMTLAEDFAAKPGTPPEVASILKDCKDSYETAAENFEKTIKAFAEGDMGTVNSMLSAVMTDVGDCEDAFSALEVHSPLAGYADKLTSMASNCLAIASLIKN